MHKAWQFFYAILSLSAIINVADAKCNWPQGSYSCRPSNPVKSNFDPCGMGQILCHQDEQPFDAHCWADKDFEPFFSAIKIEQYISPWVRATSDVECGSGDCDRSISYTKTLSITETSGMASENSSTTSHTDVKTTTISNEIGLELKAGKEGVVDVGADYKFKYETVDKDTTEQTNKTATMKSYSFAIGKSFTVTDTVKCKGKANEKLSLEMKTYAVIVKGNYCVKSAHKDEDPYYEFECHYTEVTCPATLSNGLLDVSVRCVRT